MLAERYIKLAEREEALEGPEQKGVAEQLATPIAVGLSPVAGGRRRKERSRGAELRSVVRPNMGGLGGWE